MSGYRRKPGFWAAILHRLSGVALAVFLPMHFIALGTALGGASALDGFLAVTDNVLVKTAEWGLVVALTLHLALGLRILAVEIFSWHERTAATVTACIGASMAAGLIFFLNLAWG